MKTKVVVVFAVVLIAVLLFPVMASAATQCYKTIEAGLLHDCDKTQWEFTIHPVSAATAPGSIHVYWKDKNNNELESDIPLKDITNNTARYILTDNLGGFKVVKATAQVLNEWRGVFDLSHGPDVCPTSLTLKSFAVTPSLLQRISGLFLKLFKF